MSPAIAPDRLAIDGGPRAVRSRWSEAPTIGLSEFLAVSRVLASRNLNRMAGEAVDCFEAEFARAYGARHAVASTSGTSAIHVALGALDLDPYSEVITSSITDMGAILPILLGGCRPVFADVDPETGNLTASAIAKCLTPRSRAILLTHLFGRPCADLDPIRRLADDRGLPVVEDCSQAHLAEHGGRKIGTIGTLGCFSFQQSKQMTCGDGGMTITSDPELAQRAALFADKGWMRGDGTRRYGFLGMNYRMTEVQGAIGVAQLRKLPGLMHRRRQTARRFSEGLARIPGLRPPVMSADVTPSWWKVDFAIDEESLGVTTDAFCDALRVEGVPVSRHYLDAPIYECDTFRDRRTFGKSGYPLTSLDPGIPPFTLPDGERDLPGTFRFIRERMVINWHSSISSQHVDQLLEAVQKVAALLPGRAGAATAPGESVVEHLQRSTHRI